MKLIYYCYGSAHSSVVAAALHLGKLPLERVPEWQEILSLPDFDVARDDSLGHLFYKGRDEDGHEVYTIGMGGEMDLVRNSIESLMAHCRMNRDEYYFAKALPNINAWAKIGGALSRRYGIVGIGRTMAAKGIIMSYPNLCQFVLQTKKELRLITNAG
jgi:hypothetical protein